MITCAITTIILKHLIRVSKRYPVHDAYFIFLYVHSKSLNLRYNNYEREIKSLGDTFWEVIG